MLPFEFIQSVVRAIKFLLYGQPKQLALPPPPPMVAQNETPIQAAARSLQSLREEIVNVFAQPCNLRRMLNASSRMRRQYYEKLESSPSCMLPSFCHAVPTGKETGTYIAMDVGGSTFRVAVVELFGRESREKMEIRQMTETKIDASIRNLSSRAFFDWMAECITQTLQKSQPSQNDLPIPLGLAWSFPIEQTSHRGGNIQDMGKGFNCHIDTLGQDLGRQIKAACLRRGVAISVDAVVNDSSATLVSQAYLDPATSMGLILGTGTNAAVYLPISCIGTEKFGVRDPDWFTHATRVITNTELSMFGNGVLHQTRWDETLNRNHSLPDFQPLEYMITGRYLGEILRLIIVEAVTTCNLFDGVLPESLDEAYSLDTIILAKLEEDRTKSLSKATKIIQDRFNLIKSPTHQEVTFLRIAAKAISDRAAAYLATAVHALWVLQKETELNVDGSTANGKTSIACNGSVILKYPGFKSRCEEYINMLIHEDALTCGVIPDETVVLESTHEAALLGAAVAVALADAT